MTAPTSQSRVMLQAAWAWAISTAKKHPWACMVVFSLVLAPVLMYRDFPDAKEDAKIAWGQMCRDGVCRPAALLHGTIRNNVQPLINELQARSDVKTLCLNSIGGNAMGARRITQWVASEGYDTCVPQIGLAAVEAAQGLCASACTYIFSEGRQRYFSPGARFQIHRPSVPAIRWMYAGPVDEAENPAPPPLLVLLAEPVVDFLVKSFAWTWPWESPPSQPHQRLSQEAAATPSYLLRSVPPAKLLEWGVLTESAENQIVFTKAPSQ